MCSPWGLLPLARGNIKVPPRQLSWGTGYGRVPHSLTSPPGKSPLPHAAVKHFTVSWSVPHGWASLRNAGLGTAPTVRGSGLCWRRWADLISRPCCPLPCMERRNLSAEVTEAKGCAGLALQAPPLPRFWSHFSWAGSFILGAALPCSPWNKAERQACLKRGILD